MLRQFYKKQPWRSWTISLLITFLACPLFGQQLTQPLTAEDVACNEQQLERLLRRMSAGKEFYLTPQLPNTLFVAPAGPSAGYSGMIATYHLFRLRPGELPPVEPYEHYMTFNITGSGRSLLLNPARPLLPLVSLSRERSGTNLVQPGSFFDLTLTLDPGASGGEVLAINNFREPREGAAYNGFLASSSGPGRGLMEEGLVKACHAKLTAFDLHVFSILQRVVRFVEEGEFFTPDIEIAVFRGEEPHTYRINFYPIYEEFEARGRVSAEVKISWNEAGSLGTGEIRIFPACSGEEQLGCSNLRNAAMSIFLIGPVFGGREPYSVLQPGGFYLSDQGPSEPRPLDFEALLANSAWNEPVW